MIYNDVICKSASPSDFEISETELSARIGAGFDLESAVLNECIVEFNQRANYKYAYARISISIEDSVCDFGFARVESRSLAQVLRGSSEAFIMAVSTGIEIDRLISKLHIQNEARAFLTDAIGSAAVESFADYANETICQGLNCTKRFSPGYSDFSIEFQSDLLSRLNANQTVGITLSENMMMTPQKSITAVIGIR